LSARVTNANLTMEAFMMYIWLVPLGIIVLTLLFVFRKLGAKD